MKTVMADELLVQRDEEKAEKVTTKGLLDQNTAEVNSHAENHT
jgi:hypothetical protein